MDIIFMGIFLVFMEYYYYFLISSRHGRSDAHNITYINILVGLTLIINGIFNFSFYNSV